MVTNNPTIFRETNETQNEDRHHDIGVAAHDDPAGIKAGQRMVRTMRSRGQYDLGGRSGEIVEGSFATYFTTIHRRRYSRGRNEKRRPVDLRALAVDRKSEVT